MALCTSNHRQPHPLLDAHGQEGTPSPGRSPEKALRAQPRRDTALLRHPRGAAAAQRAHRSQVPRRGHFSPLVRHARKKPRGAGEDTPAPPPPPPPPPLSPPLGGPPGGPPPPHRPPGPHPPRGVFSPLFERRAQNALG